MMPSGVLKIVSTRTTGRRNRETIHACCYFLSTFTEPTAIPASFFFMICTHLVPEWPHMMIRVVWRVVCLPPNFCGRSGVLRKIQRLRIRVSLLRCSHEDSLADDDPPGWRRGCRVYAAVRLGNTSRSCATTCSWRTDDKRRRLTSDDRRRR